MLRVLIWLCVSFTYVYVLVQAGEDLVNHEGNAVPNVKSQKDTTRLVSSTFMNMDGMLSVEYAILPKILSTT